MNPTNGKGSGRLHDRTKLSDEEMQAKWDKIFGKKDKPTCIDCKKEFEPPPYESCKNLKVCELCAQGA